MESLLVKLHSSLEKLLAHTADTAPVISSVSGLWGETISFQCSFQSSPDYTDDLYCSVKVKHESTQANVFIVEQVPCSFPCLPTSTGEYLTRTMTLIPDPLIPYKQNLIRIRPFFSQILWIELPITPNTTSGMV